MSDLAGVSFAKVNVSRMAGTPQITDFMRIRGSSHHHTGALDIAVVGTSAEALLSASAISQLDIVTVKVPKTYPHFVLSLTMKTSSSQASCLRKGLCTWLEVQGFHTFYLRRTVQVFSCAHTSESDQSTVVSPMSS